MIKRTLLFCLSLCLSLPIWAALSPDQQKAMGLEMGAVKFQSLDRLVFGDNDILFIADAMGAQIYAVALEGEANAKKESKFRIGGIDEKLASLLGTTPKEVFVRDLAFHQSSQQAYLAVRRGSGDNASHHLFRANVKGEISPVALDNVPRATYALNNVPAEDAVGRRGQKMRRFGITSMAFIDNMLYVAGLSNEAFTSTVRKVPFPFNGTETNGSLEIYHVAHARYETDAPITSFVPWNWKGQEQIVAGFTCTPLVTFPRNDFRDGKKVKGKTVAELGAGSSPTDIRSFEYDGKPYFLVANNRRAMMVIDAEDVAKQSALSEPLKKSWTTKGVPFAALPGTPAQQLDIFDNDSIIIVQRDNRGVLNLGTISEKRVLGIWD